METILSFLRNLEANNNKPWFDAHKSEYQEARAHFNAIVERLIASTLQSGESESRRVPTASIRTCVSPEMAFHTRHTSERSSAEEERSPDIADTIFISEPAMVKSILARASWQ